jgi:hypothetical protein
MSGVKGRETGVAKLKIADDAIWAKHIEGDQALQMRLSSLKPGEIVDLEIDGVFGRWQRMKDGRDGRPTLGIRPIEAMRDVWSSWQKRRGRVVDIREVRSADSYLAALTPLLSEWDSPEDEAAYRDL